MEKEIIDIVTTSNFIELSSAEKTLLSDYCKSEEEFNQLKSVFIEVDAMKNAMPSPRTETKKDLDALFAQSYPKSIPLWYNSIFAAVVPRDKPIYRQPLLQIAAVALLLLLAIPMFKSDFSEPNQLANNETILDVENEQGVLNKENTIQEEVKTELPNESVIDVTALEDEQIDVAEEVSTVIDESFEVTSSVTARSAPKDASESDFFDHPDGVFVGAVEEELEEVEIALSIPASEADELMDLLTATF